MAEFEIPISKPNLTRDDFLEIKKCFDSSWISSKSPWVDKFEKIFSKNISHTKYSVSVNSCTSALFLSLKALNIGPGHEVIMPTLTMVATINAVLLAGAEPVLVDSASEHDWNLDLDMVKSRISKKTRAIMPVALYGYPFNITALKKIAVQHNLQIINDSAEAMGSTHRGKYVGSQSDIACFSLYSNKIITSGNGGMICTNDKKIYDLLVRLRFFDFPNNGHFKHSITGYNMVLSGLQAALGYSQAKRFKKLLNKRRKNYLLYKKYLHNEDIEFIEPDKEDLPNFWFPAVIFKSEIIKKRVMNTFAKNLIEQREFFLPMHLQPVYRKKFAGQEYPVAEYFYERGLLLPSYYDLTIDQIKKVSSVIKSALN